MKQVEEKCHCGRDIYRHTDIVNEDGSLFTRNLCRDCDDVRCDAYPGACDGRSDHVHDYSVEVMTEGGVTYLRCSICNRS